MVDAVFLWRAPALDDGDASAAAKRDRADLDSDRVLLAFVFVDIDQAGDAIDGFLFKAGGQDDVDARLFGFDIAFDDLIEHLVGWE